MRRGAFTIIELLVSVGMLMLISVLLLSICDQTSRVWRSTTGKLERFREARVGFEAMTTRLSQATLNTYWDYDNRAAPTKYQRRSELRFISGPSSRLMDDPDELRPRVRPTHSVFFNAPLGFTEEPRFRGFENLLCTWGYFLEYGDDLALRPHFITEQMVPARYRSRLMELWQPAEKNGIYSVTSLGPSVSRNPRQWFLDPLALPRPPVHAIAENIVALIITPRLSQADEAEVLRDIAGTKAELSPLAPDYFYDSTPPDSANTDPRYKDSRLNPVHQLPPVLELTMVAIDEGTAARLGLSAETPDLFGLTEKFARTERYQADLLASHDRESSLEAGLIARRAGYRIFSTNVVVRAAKWSREQTN